MRTGLEIMKSPDTTAGEIADIIGKACPPVGIVHCDKTNCRDCWLAWLLTGEAVRGKAFVDAVKETYPPGTRIVLGSMGDDPRPIEPGTCGTVRIVDDMGTVHCDFDNGRQLGLIPGEDVFSVIS